MPPLHCNATVIRQEQLPYGLFRLWVRPDWPANEASWKAGQFLRIGVPQNQEQDKNDLRVMTIVDQADGMLEFYLVAVEGGTTSPRLAKLRTGDRCFVEPNITGNFTAHNLPVHIEDSLWLLGTGTGIAPFVAMKRKAWEQLQRFTHIILVHSVRYAEQLCYQQELQAQQEQFPGFRYIPVVTHPNASADSLLQQRIPQLIRSTALEQKAGVTISAENSVVMLCGNPHMIWEALEELHNKGLRKHRRRSPGNILYERYW